MIMDGAGKAWRERKPKPLDFSKEDVEKMNKTAEEGFAKPYKDRIAQLERELAELKGVQSGSLEINSFVQELQGIYSYDLRMPVEQEPMFFRTDVNFAWENRGRCTQEFLDILGNGKYMPKDDYKRLLIDSRWHRLMPRMYPCIPGWHHDSVDRNRPDKQPNYFKPRFRARHWMCVMGDDCSMTEFAVGKVTFDIPENSIYQNIHPTVEELLDEGELEKRSVRLNTIYQFDDRAWHQGVPAKARGTRLFIRATLLIPEEGQPDPLTIVKPVNEIRNQTQVYLLKPEDGGW